MGEIALPSLEAPSRLIEGAGPSQSEKARQEDLPLTALTKAHFPRMPTCVIEPPPHKHAILEGWTSFQP